MDNRICFHLFSFIHFAEGLLFGFVSVFNSLIGFGGILLFTGYEFREYQLEHDADATSFQEFLLGYTLGVIIGFTVREKIWRRLHRVIRR